MTGGTLIHSANNQIHGLMLSAIELESFYLRNGVTPGQSGSIDS
jgi:hypothetical protein